MSPCTRNCWIFAALMGAVVFAFALPGGVGVFAGVFLGFVTAWLLGGLLVLLFCEGDGGEVEAVSFDEDREDRVVARPDPLPLQPRTDAPPIAEAPRPAGMPGAPEGAGPAGAAMTFAEGSGTPGTAAGTARASGFAGAEAAATQIEDRRAVKGHAPDSTDHTAPGEAVPGEAIPGDAVKKPKKPKDDKKPAKAKADKPAKAKKSKDKLAKDSAAKDKLAKDGAAKRADDAPSTDASRIKRARDAGDDTPPPAMTVTTRDRASEAPALSDDLGRIDGIGPRLTDWLHQNGVTRFAQIAAWTPEDAADWAQRLGRWGGRIESDDWIGQARILAAGGETAHSRRVDAGEST